MRPIIQPINPKNQMPVTKADLDEYHEVERKAIALERMAKTFRDRQAQLEELFGAELKASERPSCIRHGFTFVATNGTASVKWAEEYLRECGPEKANALKAAAALTATGAKLKIHPPLDITPVAYTVTIEPEKPDAKP